MFSTLLPPEGAKTVWEDRCILVHLDNAKDVSGAAKLLPSVLLSDELPAEALPQRAAVYPPDAIGDGAEDGAGRSSLLERLTSHLQAAVAPLAAPLGLLWSGLLSGCRPRPAALPLEWHPRQPWLAAADSAGRVHVVDMAPVMLPTANGGCRPELLRASGSAPGGVKAVLANEALQQQALSLAWCPTSPGLLAVGAAGAVGLWALAGEARPPLAAAGRATGPWLRLLRTRVSRARVTALSWSPDGRLLAAASPDQAGLQVWDVASGVPTAVSAGPAAFDTVRWSPCGNYVFASGTGSRYFYIFETHRWRWARWQTAGSGPSGRLPADLAAPGPAETATSSSGGAAAVAAAAAPSVVAAAWAPEASNRHPILLAALSGQSYLVAVHLVDTPPGLTAQLLPVVLPELHRDVGGGAGPRSDGGASSSRDRDRSERGAVGVIDLAWDPRGERLAVLMGPADAQECHVIALYSTITDPLVSARLIGLARPPDGLCAAAAAAATAAGGAGAGGGAGPSSTSSTDVAAAAAEGEGETPRSEARKPAGAGAGQAAQGGLRSPGALGALPGSLTAARLSPLGSGGGAAVGGLPGWPKCIISARVGAAGVYNLPCYF